MSDTPEQKLDALKGLFAGVNRRALVNALAGDTPRSRPEHPTKRSFKQMSYYREHFGLQIKTVIDSMIPEWELKNFEGRLFKYVDFEQKLSRNSLYLKIQQSLLYLCHELDTEDKKYTKFRELLELRRVKDGIVLGYRKEIIDGTSLIAHPVMDSVEQRAVYREKIDAFLNSAAFMDELNINKLHLEDDEVAAIEGSLAALENFIYKISTSVIWIKKIAE